MRGIESVTTGGSKGISTRGSADNSDSPAKREGVSTSLKKSVKSKIVRYFDKAMAKLASTDSIRVGND